MMVTLADLTAYEQRHNHANGRENRDGHGENLSWNNGVEGVSDDPIIMAARRRDVMALLSTLFCSRGAVMLSAGDEIWPQPAGAIIMPMRRIMRLAGSTGPGVTGRLKPTPSPWQRCEGAMSDFKDIAMLREEDVAWAGKAGAPWALPNGSSRSDAALRCISCDRDGHCA